MPHGILLTRADNATSRIGRRYDDSTDDINGDMGFMYFSTDYTDFSDEAERLKFVDALGFPRDIDQDVEDAVIPTPLVYMKFEDPDDLGANSGSGGDYTEFGTPIAGADVNP